MQRMRPAPLHSAICRHKRLRHDLPAINAFPAHERRMPAEQVHLQPFEIEDGEQRFDRRHRSSGQQEGERFLRWRVVLRQVACPGGLAAPLARATSIGQEAL